jgi:hypothetical protein
LNFDHFYCLLIASENISTMPSKEYTGSDLIVADGTDIEEGHDEIPQTSATEKEFKPTEFTYETTQTMFT